MAFAQTDGFGQFLDRAELAFIHPPPPAPCPADGMAGRPYNKAQHRRSLMPLLRSRTEGSIEFKHQNISAVLKGLGEDWILGYKPAFNFQMTLVDAVARWLAWNPAWLGRMPGSRSANGLREAAQIWIGPSPTLSNQPPPLELEQMLHVAKKFDVAGRDERNRALGRAGEERVVAHERSALKVAGRDDLARKVRWVSEEDGDGAGYDIASFTPDGQERLIEVKTTNGWERTPFYISRNELAVANTAMARTNLGLGTMATKSAADYDAAIAAKAALSGATFTGVVTAPNFVSSSDARLKSEV